MDSATVLTRREGKALLLHGRGGSGPKFSDRIRASHLGDRLGLNPENCVSPSGPMRVEAQGGVHADGFAWWAFPPGVTRSYQADEWLQSDVSMDIAAEAGRDCELCIGFSQGAMLLSVLLAEGRLPNCSVAVIAGAGWPRPYASSLEAYHARGNQPVGGSLKSPSILHVTSPKDLINPIDQVGARGPSQPFPLHSLRPSADTRSFPASIDRLRPFPGAGCAQASRRRRLRARWGPHCAHSGRGGGCGRAVDQPETGGVSRDQIGMNWVPRLSKPLVLYIDSSNSRPRRPVKKASALINRILSHSP